MPGSAYCLIIFGQKGPAGKYNFDTRYIISEKDAACVLFRLTSYPLIA